MADRLAGILWFTGLPGSGKTTLATAVAATLTKMGHVTSSVDGDALRRGLCSDLGFARAERAENVRRAAEVAALLAAVRTVCLVALISPFAVDRANAKYIASKNGLRMLEIFVDAPRHVCEARDPKGLYRLARTGALTSLTGFDDPYEPPMVPDLHVRSDLWPPAVCASLVVERTISALTAPYAPSS